MAGTPEEDLLGWLEREEQRLGFTTVEVGLLDLESAQEMLYKELGMDVSPEQYAGLKQAQFLRYQELPAVEVRYERYERKWGYQAVYRYIPTGRLISQEAAFGLVAFGRE